MKKITVIFFLLFAFIAIQSVHAQRTQLATKTQNVLKTRTIDKADSKIRKKVRYVNPAQLKQGVNILDFSKFKLEFIKRGRNIVSIKQVFPNGKVGQNLASKDPGGSKFVCVGSLCFCFGDNDCNNMFTSNVCKDCINCAGCVGDDCYCEKN